MATAHIIDEVVFDFSFDSIAIARAHESDINSWLIEQLLPIVDSILNTYDDAQTVLRMEHLALDLGDISSDDFHSEIVRKVSEQLTEQLRDACKNSVFDETHAEKSPSATRPSPPPSSSTSQVKQVRQTQVDSERLIDFLLTGNMAWHIDISESNVHENMLAQVLQQTDATFVQFLQRASATTRNVLIRRLVQQFSPQHLLSFLDKLAPTSAHLISDLMVVIQSASIQTQSDSTQPEELAKWLWMLTFETLLEEVQESDRQTVVIQKVFRKFEKLQGRVPDLMDRKIVKIAENLSSNQKINAELPKILLELINGDGKQIIGKDVTSLDAPAPQELISNETQIIKDPLSPTDTSANHTEQDQTATSTAIYQRIVKAIIMANIPGIDTKVLTLGEPAELAESGKIRQQLLLLIERAEIRAQFAQLLPERVLLDMVYLLSPQVAALIEQLLVQSTILTQATDVAKQSNQSNQSSQSSQNSIATWQQQLWTGGLTALMTAQNKTLDPAEYLLALARWFSPTQSATTVMQIWSIALAQSQKYGTLHNMLQQLIAQQDQHSFSIGVNVGADVDANVGAEVSTESEPLVATQKKISRSLAYQQLYQRLSATQQSYKASTTDIDITSDLQTVINKLATDNPDELHHIFQALSQGELVLADAQLQGAELQSLVMAWIQMDAPNLDKEKQDFVRAIERHAALANDQAVYYQRVLDALLLGNVVDLEAIALQRQYAPTSIPAPVPVLTEKSTILEETQESSVAEINSPTINTAIYQRIVQAIVKANIPGIDAKALTLGESPTGPTELSVIRQQVLLLIQQAEIHALLAEKLPERVLLDLVYLLSPQTAALIEQLLAQSTILAQATETAKQSGQISIAAWQQQLWVGSLAALISAQNKTHDPAEYLQALAHWFSPSQSAKTVMQTWSTALAQSQNYGMLYDMLQQLIVQQGQHSFNVDITAGDEVSAESEPLVVTQAKVSGGSPAYQQLYKRLSTAEPDKVRAGDLQTVIDKLATDSPVELRRIFQALCHGELILAAAKLKTVELRSLLAALIQMESSDVDGFQQDFAQAIERHAVLAKDQEIYYQKVLEALLQSEIVDLEAFSSQMWEEPESGEKSEILMGVSESPAYQQLYQRLKATQSDKVTIDDFQIAIDKLATDSPEELRRIFQALRRGELILAAAKLKDAELQSLLAALIRLDSLNIGQVYQDFVQAIERHATQAINQSVYYQRILEALLQGEIVDLETFSSQIWDEPKSGEKSEILMEDSESPAYQQLYQRLKATQSDKVTTDDFQSAIDKLAIDSPEELRRIFQALRQEELVLATAKLQGAELQHLIMALIKMESSDIDEIQKDFVQTIERHAVREKDQAVYYRRVLDALLQSEVVDLKAFALQRQSAPASMPVPAPATNEKSTVLEETQESSVAEINSPTINTAIYQRIVQAIIKANIPGIDTEVLTLGEPPSGPVELSELIELSVIRQQLLRLIQQAEMHSQLVEKLPERVLLDMVYLLSPQAAALTEQLLAQSTILAQTTDKAKHSGQRIQSSESSIVAWQQQLWTGSLTALMAMQENTLDPAEYLRALARWFSPSQNAVAVMQTWLAALVHSQKYGTLHNMLQQLVTQQDQHSFNVDANGGGEASTESEALPEALIKKPESPAYQQLYQRLSTIQPDKADKADKETLGDLQTVIEKLATNHPEELHHIFQALRQGELVLAAAKLQGAELQSLIMALIQMDLSDTDKVQHDFVRAIERHAAQAKDQVVYYQWVFEALLHGEVVDLEAFALKRVTENRMPVATQPNTADNIVLDQRAPDSVVPAKKQTLIILDDALGLSSEAEVTEEIYINNAGQVLAAPYLPRLFSALNLMEDGEFVDRSSAERAVHLLQFMVNEQTQSPEYQLLLNKILCGITTGIPICREIAISAQESALIEDFIRGMIQNWKTIGETSVSGLRQTFLQRKGRLQLREGLWYLTIEPGTFDMLLDGLPWSFSVIKHAWMDRAIHVTWR